MDTGSEGAHWCASQNFVLLWVQVAQSVPSAPFSLGTTANAADTPTLLGLLICVVLLVFAITTAAILQGARAALSMINTEEFANLKKQNPSLANKVADLSHNYPRLLSGVFAAKLLLYLCATVLLSYITTPFFTNLHIGSTLQMLIVVLLIWLIAVVGERSIGGSVQAEYLKNMRWSVAFLRFFQFLLMPAAQFIAPLYRVAEGAMALQSYETDEKGLLSAETGQAALSSGVGVDSPSRPQAIARGMAKFRQLTVKQIQCNRMDLFAVDVSTHFDELCKQVIEWGYSRVPVYDEDLDHIVGILYTKELLKFIEEEDAFEWQKLVKEAYFVPQNKKVAELLKEMQRSRVHIALTVDELGSTSGLVTLEDILEEIVGDIRDEYDEDEIEFNRIDLYQYVFSGRTLLIDMCHVMNISGDTFKDIKGEADSLAGLLIGMAGKFPEEGETFAYKNYFFTVLTRYSNRIGEVKVTILPLEATGGS